MSFTLTVEQEAILDTDEDLKVNAVAGSGKTSTLIQYAKSRTSGKKLLYLVFNKSAKMDAEAKFKKSGVNNTRVQTAHSLAYGSVMRSSKYELHHKGYFAFDLMEILKITGKDNLIIAAHIHVFMSAFCNSDCDRIEQLNYRNTLTDDETDEAWNFCNKHWETILAKTEIYWRLMNEYKIKVTHEFYLKKYQLKKPRLRYDYIMFDEGQDTSPVMLDIFLRQNAIKIIVGDTHQQIYGWRGAINSLETVDFKSLELSKSFRFGKNIERIAKKIIAEKDVKLILEGAANYSDDSINSKTIIGRSNLGLLKEMVSYCKRNPNEPIFYDGNIMSLVFSDQGFSAYDILNLSQGRFNSIRSSFIQTFNSLESLEDYATKASDRDTSILIKLVKEYGSKLHQTLQDVKNHCVDNIEDATITFTTCHKAKGLEWDKVTLADDFIPNDSYDSDDSEKTENKLSDEEVNVLYVAVTRAKKEVILPMELRKYEES